MRPRPEGRGELPVVGVLHPRQDPCFNAATARRPWRTVLILPSATPTAPGFNAATARRPWRTDHSAASTTADGSASMRPRPEGRGERWVHARWDAQVSSFNAATARRPWRTGRHSLSGSRPSKLQCGHGPKAVENAIGADDGACRTCRLQCGHGPKAVENTCRCAGSVRRACTGLQCGHGPKAVENARRLPDCRNAANACFNAATARRPWRTCPHLGRNDRHRQLQCGHGPKAVENTVVNALTAIAAPALQCGHGPKAVENDHGDVLMLVTNSGASMRPRPEGRGERLAALRGRTRRTWSFNAATARRPWETKNRL